MAVIEQSLYLLAIIGLLATVISAFYYLRIIKGMYFDEKSDNEIYEFTISLQSKLILTISIVLA